MVNVGLDKNVIVGKAAELANSMGLDTVTLKFLSNSLHV